MPAASSDRATTRGSDLLRLSSPFVITNMSAEAVSLHMVSALRVFGLHSHFYPPQTVFSDRSEITSAARRRISAPPQNHGRSTSYSILESIMAVRINVSLLHTLLLAVPSWRYSCSSRSR